MLKYFHGAPLKIYLHEYLTHEYFHTRKFPDLQQHIQHRMTTVQAQHTITTIQLQHTMTTIQPQHTP